MSESEDERLQRIVTERLERPLPRRFYKEVSVSPVLSILLDGRPVKTPLKAALQLPNARLAEAVAAEWRAQDTHIDAVRMPLTKLANTAIDRATQERVTVIDEIVAYAGNDLVCYWADGPPDLVARQRQHWQPVVDWAQQKFSADIKTASGIRHVPQLPEMLEAVRRHAEAQDNWQLTALFLLTTKTGSMLLSAMQMAGAASPDDAWAAAHVDEDYQIANWGLDWEAEQRRTSRRNEFNGLMTFLELIRA